LSSKSRERDPAKHENPRTRARSPRDAGDVQESTRKTRTRNKPQGKREMQQGWMDGWMDETHQDTKQIKCVTRRNLPNSLWMSFWARKKHPTFGICVWRIFLKISKNKSKLH
jgi:hypothetical protein